MYVYKQTSWIFFFFCMDFNTLQKVTLDSATGQLKCILTSYKRLPMYSATPYFGGVTKKKRYYTPVYTVIALVDAIEAKCFNFGQDHLTSFS